MTNDGRENKKAHLGNETEADTKAPTFLFLEADTSVNYLACELRGSVFNCRGIEV